MKYKPVQNYIKGVFVNTSTTRTQDVVSPLDGLKLSEVPMSTAHELGEAVRAAKAVFPHWSKTPIKERVQVFFRYKYLLEKIYSSWLNYALKKMEKPLANQLQKLKNVLS
ncbi:MAG: aldehyde dehydrogenase family protein [Chitinophagaceae bacterium]